MKSARIESWAQQASNYSYSAILTLVHKAGPYPIFNYYWLKHSAKCTCLVIVRPYSYEVATVYLLPNHFMHGCNIHVEIHLQYMIIQKCNIVQFMLSF